MANNRARSLVLSQDQLVPAGAQGFIVDSLAKGTNQVADVRIKFLLGNPAREVVRYYREGEWELIPEEVIDEDPTG